MAEGSTAARGPDLRRWFRISCRSAHLLTVSVLVGGHVFDVPADELVPWLYGVIASGAGLMVTDLFQGLGYLREVRGAANLAKIAMAASVAWLWDWRVPILFAVVLLSGVVSHMPGHYRYWVIGRGPRQGSAPENKAGLG